jgi:hypothetical protein
MQSRNTTKEMKNLIEYAVRTDPFQTAHYVQAHNARVCSPQELMSQIEKQQYPKLWYKTPSEISTRLHATLDAGIISCETMVDKDKAE